METRYLFLWLYFIFTATIQDLTAQEIKEANCTSVQLAADTYKEFILIDADVDTVVSLFVGARVRFRDSLSLNPFDISLVLVRTKDIYGQTITYFSSLSSEWVNSTEIAGVLFKNVEQEIRAFFMNSCYVFSGEPRLNCGTSVSFSGKLKVRFRKIQ